LNHPLGLAVDSRQSLFIGDTGNHRICRIDADGTITTVAGTGKDGYAGDGGPASAAAFRGIGGIALDASGSLIIVDRLNLRIRELNRDGNVTTVAGNGTVGAAGDGGPAINAQLGYPSAVSVGADGTVYVADAGNGAVRTIAPDGIIRTLVSSSRPGERGDAASPTSFEPAGVALDNAGNVFFTDRRHNRLFRVDRSGKVTTVVGSEPRAASVHEVRVEPDSLSLLPAEQATAVTLSWEYRFLSGSDDNATHGVVSGADGHVYVAGDIGTGADWRIQELDASGKPGWHFDFGADNVDVPYGLMRTSDGQIVAAGMSFGGDESGRDATVIALGKDGHERWRHVDAKPGAQTSHAIAADGANNLYVAGESAGHWDVVSFDGKGTPRWHFEDGTAGSANDISVSADGHVFVAGNEPQGWRVIKLTPDHQLAWQHRIPGRAAAHGIRAMADGSAIVVGTHTTQRLNLRAERLNAAGEVMWEYEATSPVGPVVAHAVTLDANEMPIIAGEIGTDWLILALDAAGKRSWHFTHDGGGGVKNRDQAYAIAFQQPDTILVAGRIHPHPLIPPSLGQVEWRVASYRMAEKTSPRSHGGTEIDQ
jgi:sugar lactone lactonase YvrE